MFMTFSRKSALVVTTTALLAVAACGSSSGGGSSPSGGPTGSAGASGGTGGGGKTITVGLLTDVTGPAASGNKTSVDGVKAGVVYASRNGYTVKYIVGDTATNPATTLSIAQKFVTRDHVDAVLSVSSLTFAAAPYLTARGVPVIGAGQDGPEWLTAKNMFSVFGALNTTKVAATQGEFFKAQGVTTLGAIGYSVSPISSETAKAAGESAKAAGLKVGYLNSSFPFGSTDVQPVALAMKAAGVDGFTASTDPNTAFALISALRNSGADVKVALLASGYGGDILQAGPGALKAAQNVYFSLGYEPIEMQTTATKQFAGDLTAAGIKGSPTVASYNGYLSVGLLVQALKDAKGSTKASDIIGALNNIHSWDGLGLYGTHRLDLSDRTNIVSGVDNCLWMTKLEGDKFTLVKGATPICGKTLPGVTVKPST